MENEDIIQMTAEDSKSSYYYFFIVRACPNKLGQFRLYVQGTNKGNMELAEAQAFSAANYTG